jgi:L-idonate 5-dehydrogenase
VLKPLGILVQVGLGGDVSIPQNIVVSKEIDMRGSFRFHEEFGLAVDMINRKAVDVKPLLSSVYPLEDVLAAFEIASDRNQSMKVQLAF